MVIAPPRRTGVCVPDAGCECCAGVWAWAWARCTPLPDPPRDGAKSTSSSIFFWYTFPPGPNAALSCSGIDGVGVNLPGVPRPEPEADPEVDALRDLLFVFFGLARSGSGVSCAGLAVVASEGKRYDT